MVQQAALTTAQLDTIRTGKFTGDQYLCIWEEIVIFQAQVNQATFASGFASITYNNVTVGAYTDIKADFVCYVGSVAGELQDAEQVFRVRETSAGVVATSTVLNINETSASLTDDWYIMVVKDVRCDTKLPRTISDGTPANNTYPRDYAISTYRPLKPTVYNVQSCYILILDDDGIADEPIAPLPNINDADASSITTWAWDIDGLAFQVGSSSTQDITMRATATGQYMPRVTLTDDQGNIGYFTFRVWVVPADLSSVVNLAFSSAKITRDTINGDTCAINANIDDARDTRLRIDNLVDYSFVAIWWKTDQPIITSDIVFVGRFSKEVVSSNNVVLQQRMGIPLFNTNFVVDGVATQMSDVISRRLPILEKAAPSVFGEIKTLTPWRALVYFLTEHSTIMNVHAFKFDDTSDDYNWPRFSTGDSSALASALDIMFTINASLNYLPTGEVNVNRMAWYLDDTDRDALTTIANYTTQDMATRGGGGLWYSLSRAYVPQIGREMAGGAFYNTTSKKEQIMQAITPSVAQSRGTSLTTFNRQILIANSTLDAAANEMGQRTTDDVEARQPQTILNVTHASAHWFQSPSDSDWFTWTFGADTNNRGVSSDNTVRWTLRQMSLDFDITNGVPIVTGQYKLETQGGDWQSLVTTPIASGVHFFNPVKPVAPVYDAFPEEPGNDLADDSAGALDDEENQNPFDEDDSKIVNKPEDPSVALGNSVDGRTGIVWDDDNIWSVKNITTAPEYFNITPGITGTVRNARFNNQSSAPAAWALTSNESVSSVWRTESVLGRFWLETDTSITGEYTLLREVAGLPSQDRVYVYSPGDIDFTNSVDLAVPLLPAGVTVNSGTFTANVGVVGTDDADKIDAEFAFGATMTIDDITMTLDGVGAPLATVNVYSILSGVKTLQGTGSKGNGLHTFTFTAIQADTIQVTSSRPFSHDLTQMGTTADGGVLTRYSTNDTKTFASPVSAGVATFASPLGGFDGYSRGDIVYAAMESQIRQQTAGGAFSDVATGTNADDIDAMCIRLFGTTGDRDYLYGSTVADGGETVWKIVGGAKTDITPNDGTGPGIVASAESLDVVPKYPTYYFGLFDFGGTVKFCYSSDSGSTWTYNTQVSNDAVHIAVRNNNAIFYIFIADAATLWVGIWKGTGAITLVAKTAPSATITGVEVR